MTEQGLKDTMKRLTENYRIASDKSWAASKSRTNFQKRQELVDQSYFKKCMGKFGDWIQNYMLAEHETDQAMALGSAHQALYCALDEKPTAPEKDSDYVEMRQQAYLAVLSKYSSVLGFDPESRRDRDDFEAGKPGKPWGMDKFIVMTDIRWPEITGR